MIEFLSAGANLAFTVALAIMLLLGALEVAGLLLGASVSQLLENILPDSPDAGVEAPDGALAWLGLGMLPVYVLGLLLLAGFGLSGLTVQFAMASLAGWLLPAAVSWLPALLGGLLFTRLVSRALTRLGLFREETTAVSPETLLGWPAVVTLGTAAVGSPAEAKARDRFGQTHYFMVEPMDSTDRFPAGTSVVLMRRKGAVFGAVRDLGNGEADAGALRRATGEPGRKIAPPVS